MSNWRIVEDDYDIEKISSQGNKFLVGNGYLGIRGTMPEYNKEQFVAINLAGIYDQVGDGWREPLNAPNGLYTFLKLKDQEYRLPQMIPDSHQMALDYRHGLFERVTTFAIPGGRLTLKTQRFASMEEKHLICMQYRFLLETESVKELEAELYTGIDADVWDINGPHYDKLTFESETGSTKLQKLLTVTATTHQSKDQVVVCESCVFHYEHKQELISEEKRLLRKFSMMLTPGKEYTLYKFISVYTSKDANDYESLGRELAEKASIAGYQRQLELHQNQWELLWKNSEVYIEGDDAAMEAMNYSLYHLHCIAPRHTDQLSIAARGLSGQTYKGAVFWDTEMFMLDFFLLTEPKVAKTLLKYRIDTLPGAKIKAKHYGYQGAFYAWESQEGGYDACSDYNVTDVFTGRQMRTYFKDKQIHISAAVVYGIMRYTDYTGTDELLTEGGAEVILECARFYYDLLLKKVGGEHYELHDVIGPDEYHERVNNNAYTNRMAKYTFDSALRILTGIMNDNAIIRESLQEKYDIHDLQRQFTDASTKLTIPAPKPDSGVIEQFDGYFALEEVGIEELKGRLLHEKEYWGGAYGVATHTKVIKQADVVTMLNLFSQDYEEEILRKNWEYYEPRTEHGSSLSACMYAILACKCHMPEKAYPFFLKSALSDLSGKGKEWAGLIYIGGTHPASSGGAYMTAVEGFAGIHLEEGKLVAQSCLPPGWKRMSFPIRFRDESYVVEVTKDQCLISKRI